MPRQDPHNSLATTTNIPRSPQGFFDLPRELRNHIYSLIIPRNLGWPIRRSMLTLPDGHIHHYRPDTEPSRPIFWLLQATSQFRGELQDFIRSTSTSYVSLQFGYQGLGKINILRIDHGLATGTAFDMIFMRKLHLEIGLLKLQQTTLVTSVYELGKYVVFFLTTMPSLEELWTHCDFEYSPKRKESDYRGAHARDTIAHMRRISKGFHNVKYLEVRLRYTVPHTLPNGEVRWSRWTEFRHAERAPGNASNGQSPGRVAIFASTIHGAIAVPGDQH